jgi:hypothetical protein
MKLFLPESRTRLLNFAGNSPFTHKNSWILLYLQNAMASNLLNLKKLA